MEKPKQMSAGRPAADRLPSVESLTFALEQIRSVATEITKTRSNNDRLMGLCEQAIGQYELAMADRDKWHRCAIALGQYALSLEQQVSRSDVPAAVRVSL